MDEKKPKIIVTAEQILEAVAEKKAAVEEMLEQLEDELTGFAAVMDLPISRTGEGFSITIAKPRQGTAASGGKRTPVRYGGKSFATYAALCDHLGLPHKGNSAHRVLDTAGIEYDDKPATDSAEDTSADTGGDVPTTE